MFGVSTTKWQRDHVYYNLTNNDSTGPLNTNMQETIVSLRINREGLRKISDQTGDPILTSNPNRTIEVPYGAPRADVHNLIQKNAWTDGKFEFRFDALINNKRGIGAVYSYYLPASPTDLFYIPNNYTLRTVNGTRQEALVVYRLSDEDLSGNSFSKELIVDIPIINWDLQSNAPIWKITVYETDSQETYTSKESVTNEFATNFGLNLKIGFNFGVSNKETVTREVTVTRTVGEDDLGSVLVDFGDPIMIGGGRNKKLYEYSNDYYTLKIIPTRRF